MSNILKGNDRIHVGFWSPYLKSQRGNSTTAKRIVSGLRAEGFLVEVFAYNEDDWDEQAEERMSSCDLYHILHFDRFANWVEKSNFHINRPYLVTSGGTDVNEKMTHAISRNLLLNANAISVFTKEAAHKVIATYPSASDKIHIIPQSIYVPQEVRKLEQPLPKGYPKVLLPAGLREVKDIFYVFDALLSLRTKYPSLQLMIVGEAIESHVEDKVHKYKGEYPWFHYGGSIPLEEMVDMYKWADVVLNTSKSEGQPIALMEAMYHQVPVIARQNAGNESLIQQGYNGFLFQETDAFETHFIELIENSRLNESIVLNGHAIIKQCYSIQTEIENYKRIYEKMMR
ncbi:glycosyltransferase [Pseudalkalibacillus berkeleyi]|uniref:Glycosyltransferase family 4 protein n=1 Tax=Pseudalkalibacillus berkeleyi TaxID=1069813 RepID=A0ABS9GX13_9BACL|nr:glycosyltransferase [Pseudalkalibacillus berkeleyi]MCF6137229.1 glycosyltransferase family 4 protein [Pseudalkalibacillus berkeleyi]